MAAFFSSTLDVYGKVSKIESPSPLAGRDHRHRHGQARCG
ncbi:protein of unknown function [Paraburkholderia kururiensis]